jgi:hypothetical protein
MEKKADWVEKTGGSQPIKRNWAEKGYQPSSNQPKPKPQDIRLPQGTGAVKPKKDK